MPHYAATRFVPLTEMKLTFGSKFRRSDMNGADTNASCIFTGRLGLDP